MTVLPGSSYLEERRIGWVSLQPTASTVNTLEEGETPPICTQDQ